MPHEWYPIEALSHADLYEPKQGQLHSVTVRNKLLCVAFHEGKWHAVDARCPHQRGPLAGGHVDDSGAIVCPWHRFAFDLHSGECRTGGYFLESYEVKKERGELWVKLPKRRFLGIF